MESGYPTSYSEIWDGFEPVSVRLTREQRTLRDVAGYFSKRASIEDNYAKSLIKLSKSVLGKGETGMLASCLQSLKEECEDRGNTHLEFAKSLKEEAKALDTFSNTTKKAASNTLASGLKMTKSVAQTKIAEAKSKDKYYKYAQMSGSDEKLLKKSEDYNRDYTKRVDLLKNAQTTFYSGMPPILSSLQSVDEQTLDRLDASWNALISYMELMTPTLNSLATTLKRTIDSFDKSKEITDFITSIYSGEERPPLAVYTPYDGPKKYGSNYDSGYSSSSSSGSSFFSGGGGSSVSSSASGSSFGATGPSTYRSGSGGSGGKTPTTKASRISMIFSSPTNVLAKDKDLNNYYDQKNFYDQQLQEADQYGGNSNSGSNSYKCRVLYDWTADDSEAISISSGEIIDVNAEDSGWLFGSNSKGQSGRFPASYVQYI